MRFETGGIYTIVLGGTENDKVVCLPKRKGAWKQTSRRRSSSICILFSLPSVFSTSPPSLFPLSSLPYGIV